MGTDKKYNVSCRSCRVRRATTITQGRNRCQQQLALRLKQLCELSHGVIRGGCYPDVGAQLRQHLAPTGKIRRHSPRQGAQVDRQRHTAGARHQGVQRDTGCMPQLVQLRPVSPTNHNQHLHKHVGHPHPQLGGHTHHGFHRKEMRTRHSQRGLACSDPTLRALFPGTAHSRYTRCRSAGGRAIRKNFFHQHSHNIRGTAAGIGRARCIGDTVGVPSVVFAVLTIKTSPNKRLHGDANAVQTKL